MLAAKSPAHAVGATLFFNICHYAVRPWPWILVALASIVVFPDLRSLGEAFPNIPADKVGHDMAYPAMMTLLPHGVFGIVVASLFAAYMSTIATHLNLGSSYMVNDFYKRFLRPDLPHQLEMAQTELQKAKARLERNSGDAAKTQALIDRTQDKINAIEGKFVFIGRLWTVLFMIIACCMAIFLENALGAFQILLSIGAGTGLLFLLRWFWWRVNAYSEIAAMCFAFPIACFFQFHKFAEGSLMANSNIQLVVSVAITTIGWLAVTFLTPPDDKETLREFVRKTRAGGPGWKKVYDDAAKEGVKPVGADDKCPDPLRILCSVVGCIAIYAALFGVGQVLYGHVGCGVGLLIGAVVAGFLLFSCWKKMENVSAMNK